jgi:hypothetical protein
MAAFSFSFLVPACVGRTRLIHRHSLAARLLDVFLACDFLAYGPFLRRGVWGNEVSLRGILSVRDIFMERGVLFPRERGVLFPRERGVLFPRERGVFVEHARSVPM